MLHKKATTQSTTSHGAHQHSMLNNSQNQNQNGQSTNNQTLKSRFQNGGGGPSNQVVTSNKAQTNVSIGHIHMNIPLSPQNSSKPLHKQKLRVVSPISRPQEDLDSQEFYLKSQDCQNPSATLASLYQRFNESPEMLADFTHIYNNQPTLNSNTTLGPTPTSQAMQTKQQQQYLQSLQMFQSSSQLAQYQSNGNQIQTQQTLLMSEYDSVASTIAGSGGASRRILKGKKIADDQQQNMVVVNPKYHDTMFCENGNLTIDDEGIYSNMNQLCNGQTIFHEKAKSLTSNQFIKQSATAASANIANENNSGSKRQNLLLQQQLLQQYQNQMQLQQQSQLSPAKMKALLQMSKVMKNHSSTSQQRGDQVIDPTTISPGSNQQKQPLKTRRKKSQGKININFQNMNPDDILKTQQNQQTIRSSSQPQIRSQSQQANSQERPILQLKKNSIKTNNNIESSSNLLQFQQKQQQQQLQQQMILKQQDTLRIAQLENSVERMTNNAANLCKQGSLKIVLKKNGSVKQLTSQQTALKISKDQILLKNSQNYNSQGSGSTNQNSQANLRSRSLSNSKFTKKKASPTLQGVIQDSTGCQADEQQQLFTQRGQSNKEKNIIGNSFNQSITITNKQRCKSSTKTTQSTVGIQQEDQQISIQTNQGGGSIPIQNSSKVLMFKTNNEESNAKVAALKSIIKLSSNTNTNYMQAKPIQQRNQSKENLQNQSSNQLQNGIQMKQIVQKIKIQETNQGQFVQKCASATQNPNKPPQQSQQYMQRITSSRVVNQQSLNYHAQLKTQNNKEIVLNQNETTKLIQPQQKDETRTQNQIKINITSQNSLNNMISQDSKDNSSSLKLGQGQVNIRNIKVNSSQQQQQQLQQKSNHEIENMTSLASISTNKAQINHQQKMHQILLNQQNKQQPIQNQTSIQNIGGKQTISRNAFNAASTLEGSNSSLTQKRQSAGIDIIPKTLIIQSTISGGPGSNDSFRANESNQKSVKDQFSRKNSTLSNGSVQTQIQTIQKELLQSTNIRSDVYTIKNQSKDIISRLQNTSQLTYNTNAPESAQRNERAQKQSERQTIYSENINNYNNSSKPLQQFSDDKCSAGKKLNFYNQMSPTSEVLSHFKDSQMISAFKNNDDDSDINSSQCCMEDESIVIIQEDQLRLPLRSSKQSQQSAANQDSQKFIFDEEILQRQEIIQFPTQAIQPQNQVPQMQPHLMSKEDMVLQSIESDRSVFKKKHDTSVIEQESLVTQIKTQLMKIQFQQAFQGDASKQKRQRNQNKDCQTMKDAAGSNKLQMDLDNSLKQSNQGSGTFYFEPQFDDISFELDTCNQIRVPKNMNNPIDEANIMSLPEDLQIYSEKIDPHTGKVKFTLDKQTVTLLTANIRKANILKAENQVLKQSVVYYPDPLQGRLKQDYETNQEEKREEDAIEKQLETTFNLATNSNQQLVTEEQSLSFRHSLCSSNNYSLNTFLSEDVSLNSNLISQVMNSQPGNQITAGIMLYAAEKLNVREGDPLFLLPRLNDNICLQLKPALLKREPEWWFGHELSLFGSNSSKRNSHEPILETFIF